MQFVLGIHCRSWLHWNFCVISKHLLMKPPFYLCLNSWNSVFKLSCLLTAPERGRGTRTVLPDRWSLRGSWDGSWTRGLWVSPTFLFPSLGRPITYQDSQPVSQAEYYTNKPQWGSQLSVWVTLCCFGCRCCCFCEIDVDAVNIFNLINNVQCCQFFIW